MKGVLHISWLAKTASLDVPSGVAAYAFDMFPINWSSFIRLVRPSAWLKAGLTVVVLDLFRTQQMRQKTIPEGSQCETLGWHNLPIVLRSEHLPVRRARGCIKINKATMFTRQHAWA